MKLLEIPMVATSLFGLCLLSGLDAPAAHADFTLGSPTNLGPAINTSGDDAGPCLSPDGLEFYFSRLVGNICEIWVARRATPDSEWGLASRLGPPIGPGDAGEPFLTSDGLSLYFDGTRPGGYGDWDLWMTTWAAVKDNWGTPVNLGATVNSAYQDWAPSLTADGLELYFTSNRPGGSGGWDVWVTTRATIHDAWGVPVNLGPTINTSAQDNWPGISPDGLVLFFGSSRPGGSGSWEIYMARRSTRNAPWGPPVNVGPVVNSSVFEVGTRVSPDGSMLFFQSPRAGGYGATDVWQAPIIPILDFNGDGNVDAKDMTLLAVDWGKSNSACDIGPFAWGDGVVDEKDLGVLMKSLVAPSPSATDVSCDVVLSWTSPSSAPACDVYLGTSFEAVSSADRTNPQGVLVSQGQTASTYDPEGILELSQTYYWRVDFVSADVTPIIYKGPVSEFTTAGLTYPIKNITATASSAQAGSGPENTMNGSGLNNSDGHSIDAKDMWWSLGTSPNWIQYEFDKVYTLHEMWVWNFNSMVEPFVGFGAKTVKIEYSTDGTTWTPLAHVPEFAKASGKPGYTANTIVSFAATPAKYVKLTIEKNWGVAPQTGLSEVRFFCIQSAAVPKP